MKTTTMATLTAVLLSAAGVMEAQGFRGQPRSSAPQFQQHPAEREPMNRPQRGARNFTPATRVQRVRGYNNRPGGVHIDPNYFAAHYGYAHVFHFAADPFREYGGELYFNFNGGWFGVVGPVPGNWALQAESFYIGWKTCVLGVLKKGGREEFDAKSSDRRSRRERRQDNSVVSEAHLSKPPRRRSCWCQRPVSICGFEC